MSNLCPFCESPICEHVEKAMRTSSEEAAAATSARVEAEEQAESLRYRVAEAERKFKNRKLRPAQLGQLLTTLQDWQLRACELLASDSSCDPNRTDRVLFLLKDAGACNVCGRAAKLHDCGRCVTCCECERCNGVFS